jgi:UDP-N-acetylglucosamine 1-carboxyvinyltransferase
VGASFYLDEASVTATETALIAAVTASGSTEIRNAAGEPHVAELARFLRTSARGSKAKARARCA